VVRYWDLAATEKTEFNDPDWTVGIKLGRDKNGGFWLLDMVRGRANPGDVEKMLLNTAAQDGKRVRIGFGQDPGQAGKSQAQHLVRGLTGFTVRPATESGDKLTRFGPFSSQCLAGNVKILRGSWNEELFRILEGFPDLAHDDEVDACSGALEMLTIPMAHEGYFHFMRQQAEKLKTPKAETWVWLRVPPQGPRSVSIAGTVYNGRGDETCEVRAEDAEMLLLMGWTKVAESDKDAP
jgi:predicted phage terminase large subunit-like protein